MEPVLKTARKTLQIGTHDGVFHCDEALACFMLKQLPQYKNSEIVRTRDDSVLEKCDIVVDVGGKYDPTTHRYDHHQRGFAETGSSLIPGKPWKIKLSSAGLVYCHFGREIIHQLVPDLNEKEIEPVFNYVYEKFVQEIDAIDNGVPICEGEPKYRISTNLSARVGHLNPPWNAPPEDPKCMDRFEKAVALVGSEFIDRVQYASSSWWPARKYVLDAINDRFKVHESGQIMELKTFCPWKEHFFELAKELEIVPSSINFVLFNGTDGSWRVQGVPEDATSFVGKIFLHPDWRGLRSEELSKVSGVDGCIFAHASGFIGGNSTRDGALAMAVKSLDQPI
ncbi:MYG1 exonuclease [Frankliniella occidentalis]|uniref:MYG1 exonuclease n=1 Tax=Frankliniella occidentalis TaxID=133901 RepID=A0A6J1SZW2_FRAOC|nr:MYG1 exonuclease [Frankliniella occidentalis]